MRIPSTHALAGALAILAAGHAAAYSPDALVPTALSHTFDVGFGNSVFAAGTEPELGGGSLTLAPKLVYTAGAVWTASVGLPPNSSISLQYMNRADGPSSIGNAGNGSALGSPVVINTGSNPGFTQPATKTFDYYSGWAAPLLQVETTPGNYASVAMTDVGAGRTVGERRWRATGFGNPGHNVRFRLSDGAGSFDLAIGGELYDTYLDRALVQDGNVYNYEPAATVSASRIETIASVASPQGLQSRSVRVYLPRGYDQHTDRRYPVLYMHDGQNIYGATGSGFPSVHWNVDGSLDRLIRLGQVREVIVVGIDNTSARLAEYTPPSAPPGGLAGGTGNLYLAYVRDTVKALIDATYRTKSGAADTGTAGSSLGGLIATYMGLEASAAFSKIGALSPAYWANLNVVTRLTTDATLPNWRHYMDSGTAGSTSEGSPDGYSRCFDARDRMLLRGQVLNVNVKHAIGVGQQHDESAWQSRFPQAARFLFPIEDETNTVAPVNSAVENWESLQ